MYGPWFYPPTASIAHPPVANPYYDGASKTVNLTWTDKSANETNFVVYRGISLAGPWTTPLVSLNKNTTSYSDLIGNTNQVYFYKVVATNTVGDTETLGFPTITTQSLDSNIITVGTPASNAPAAPTNLTGVIQAGPKNLLSWTDNATNETGFLIQRSVNGAPETLLTTMNANNKTGKVSFLDSNVTPGNTYAYRVDSINSSGTSTYTNTVTLVIPSLPLAPTTLTATASVVDRRNAKVKLTWNDRSNNETGFTIDRSTDPTFTGRNLVSVLVNANTTTYTTGNLSRNTRYYFRIRANGAAGSTAWLNATPFPVTTP